MDELLMITQSDGYHALIEFLGESLAVFEPIPQASQGGTSIKLYVRYRLIEEMALIFTQKKHLQQQEKIYIVQEFDSVLSDLGEVLGRLINHQIIEHQQAFINEYAGLVKNLFDTQLEYA